MWDEVVSVLERAWLPADHPHETLGSLPYIPLPVSRFVTGLAAIGPPDGRRLLDVGCGIGTKLLVAHAFGWRNLAGVELHAAYADQARAMCPFAVIVNGDAWCFDAYEDFDVIYCYHPCWPADHEARLERTIAAACRPGTTLFFPDGRATALGTPDGDDVWRVREAVA